MVLNTSVLVIVVAHPDCYGRIDALNRLTYIGQWKGGKREGQGKMTWKDGDVYVGGFKSNTKEGQGTYTWSNGGSYHGKNGSLDKGMERVCAVILMEAVSKGNTLTISDTGWAR